MEMMMRERECSDGREQGNNDAMYEKVGMEKDDVMLERDGDDAVGENDGTGGNNAVGEDDKTGEIDAVVEKDRTGGNDGESGQVENVEGREPKAGMKEKERGRNKKVVIVCTYFIV